MNRKQRTREIVGQLGKRRLVWFGSRGTDARVLLQIPQLSEIFSITSPFESTFMVSEVSLENLKKERADLHTYSPDRDTSPEAQELHCRLFTALRKPTVVLTSKPSKFFGSVYFPHYEFVEYLGLFYERHAPFEYKPWVETELKNWGVTVIPHYYYGKHDLPQIADFLKQGPVVLRPSRSDGGAGIILAGEPGDIDVKCWPFQDDFITVSPYLVPNIPINVNACVFQDGSVSLHAPSVQLIGIPLCTGIPLGFCGNDFALIRDLDPVFLDAFESMAVSIGKWLAQVGYIGAFGIDAIIHRGKVYFTEINARFQGSSAVAAEIDEELERPDVFLNHMAAFFGLAAPPSTSLREIAKHQRRVSQVLCYNSHSQTMFRSAGKVLEQRDINYTLLPASDIAVKLEGMLFQAIMEGSVTVDGHTLMGIYERPVQDFVRYQFTEAI